jgi:hypothetical protein
MTPGPIAHRRPIITADMTTYYCPDMEEVLRRAKKAELAGERGVSMLLGNLQNIAIFNP